MKWLLILNLKKGGKRRKLIQWTPVLTLMLPGVPGPQDSLKETRPRLEQTPQLQDPYFNSVHILAQEPCLEPMQRHPALNQWN
ncbi:unnamed protein product, partial [Staurois parvus]